MYAVKDARKEEGYVRREHLVRVHVYSRNEIPFWKCFRTPVMFHRFQGDKVRQHMSPGEI